MNHHVLISLFSERWWYTSFTTLFLIGSIILISKNLSPDYQKIIQKLSGIIILISVIAIHPVLIEFGQWSLQDSLPLHLCGITSILAGLVILFPNQLLYEIVLYWGITGGIHSILTPELTEGDKGFLLPQYFIAHGGMVYTALFLTLVLEYRPSNSSWLKALLTTNVLALIVGVINYFLNSNYMYLCKPPIADNPLFVGKWPWYILVFELAGLAHFWLIYFIFKQRNKMQINSISEPVL